MQITDVKIYPRVQGTLRGYAEVTFDDCLSIREFKLLRTATGYRVCMPEVKQQDGTVRRVAYPTDDKMLKAIDDAVIAEYKKVTRRKYPKPATSMAAYLVRKRAENVHAGIVLRDA